ncbi:hypothetical protein MKK67_06285 [Methylobacterium sp. J-072]|uniref:hypothetical protein n=1 Tax=Methylobacterium sp. J-072 TaxID=2836651 RepID=UPI001FBA9E95|nr:hypothetical protein [Methylobacterium sp. J-072]MCJ2092108.1 hypothetical protein [Methylobacterium sp. J-072]
MSKRPPKLPPPTRQEREAAAIAAEALAAALADPATMGERSVAFLDFSNPRRGERHITWASLPGFLQVNDRYSHACLPGWEYTRAEIEAEMIPDLRALAEHGVRPAVATAGKLATPDLFGVLA